MIGALDYQILRYLTQHFQNDTMTMVMRFFSAVGNYGLIWIVLAVVLLLIRKTRRCGAILLIALAIEALLGEGLLKHLVMRPRPFLQYPDLPALITPPASYSFPSGHTMASFCAATVLFCRNKIAGSFAYLLALLIGFSRLYLCVHFPTDVAVGLILGCLVGVFTYMLCNYIADTLHYSKLR